jgi:ABC-type branched-subunit amino acid transport system permease subunit
MLARPLSLPRFALAELLLWASLYPAYLAARGATIEDPDDAKANAARLIDLERALWLFHEERLQSVLSVAAGFFSAYYMVGFGPLIAAVLFWFGLRRREHYRDLRTLLFVSLAIAVVLYVLYPTAPPRLVSGLGISDTVGLAGHDTGSFAGIRFNPYAAMPSMHVGWSLLVGLVGWRAVSSRVGRGLFALHPAVMAITVTATGNHYFVDSIAGATIAVVAVALVAGARRMRARRAR